MLVTKEVLLGQEILPLMVAQVELVEQQVALVDMHESTTLLQVQQAALGHTLQEEAVLEFLLVAMAVVLTLQHTAGLLQVVQVVSVNKAIKIMQVAQQELQEVVVVALSINTLTELHSLQAVHLTVK
jgi:hypothetical protein